MPRLLTTTDETAWDNRMTGCEAAMADLVSRTDDAEDDIGSLASRMDTAETKVASLEAWRAAKANAIANLGAAPSASTVDVLGIQVPTGSSYTALIAYVATIKTKVDAALEAMRSREIIAAA